MESHETAALFHRSVFLTGATASGKTDVALALARLLDAEIVALDSMTLYRGMDIGTAKPTAAERAEIPHHLIDVLDPWDSTSVAGYREMAARAASAIEGRGRRTLFVGGTPLYLKTLLRGLFEGPGADEAIRGAMEAEADERGNAHLHARLAAVDPETAGRLPIGDRRRVIRALEVLALTGRTLGSHHAEHDKPAPPWVNAIALWRPRPQMHARIDARVLSMFEAGLVEEVRGLLDATRPLGLVPSQGVGYREVIELLAGRCTLAEAVFRTQARTRQFAKRQETWFRGLSEVRFRPVGDETPEALARSIAAEVDARRPPD
ncbi:tRNA (adenosine(37)-N6)-dimethylallyltransferase MiaA [Isosphaeraceae bacterium EP7]